MNRSLVFKAVIVAILAGCFALPAAAQSGKVYTHADGGIEFTAPDNWKVVPDGDSISIYSPDDSVAVFFAVVEATDLDAAIGALTTELDKVITDSKLNDDGKQVKLNGLDAYVVDGTGKLQGTAIDFALLLVKGKKPMMIVGVGKSTSLAKYQDSIDELVASIRPAK